MKDGADISQQMLFDVVEDNELPVSKKSCFCADEGISMVYQFLEQYYNLYDSDTREALTIAYHNDALFSITSTYPPAESSTNSPK
jgi:nuclear RNA export factor